MSQQEQQTAEITAKVEALTALHGAWSGDVPEVITGERALHLAVTAGFGSLQRIGHKRGKRCTANSAAKVAQERGFTVEQVADLKLLAEQRSSDAAKATAKWCAAFLRTAERNGAGE